MKKVLIILVALVAYFQAFASIPFYQDGDQIITMDDKVYMKGEIPVVMMEIEPISKGAKLYWGSAMSGVISIPAKVVIVYAFSPDWTEYTIASILFYNREGDLIDQQESEGELVWEKTSQNSRAIDMATIAKRLPKEVLSF